MREAGGGAEAMTNRDTRTRHRPAPRCCQGRGRGPRWLISSETGAAAGATPGPASDFFLRRASRACRSACTLRRWRRSAVPRARSHALCAGTCCSREGQRRRRRRREAPSGQREPQRAGGGRRLLACFSCKPIEVSSCKLDGLGSPRRGLCRCRGLCEAGAESRELARHRHERKKAYQHSTN